MLHREDYKKELAVPSDVIRKGANGSFVKKVQEWINLHKYHTLGFSVHIGVDGDYGPITESAIEDFQEHYGLDVNGEVDALTWMQLVAPMQRAFTKINVSHDYSVKDLVVAYAQQFVKEHPTELGNNSGPWVRAFMKGKEGDWAAWCCGSVSTVIDHACNSLDKSMEDIIGWEWSCERMRDDAVSRENTTYMNPEEVKEFYSEIEPGDLFLVMKNGRANHIGIVEKMKGDIMCTIEGNTNDEGSREGYEFVRRKRKTNKGIYSIIKLS
ncbi:MAG: peptidoglycan-binding domain-containing protein [Candidatus Kariarchaeaceae archaeon]|jgi:hypothetical protein